jgi:fructokinase
MILTTVLYYGPMKAAVATMRTGLEAADIVKVSKEELELLSGTGDSSKGSALLFERGIRVILVTLGSKGSFFRYPGGMGQVPGFSVKTVDTTGAGEAFMGGVLYCFSMMTLGEIQKLSQNEFIKIIRFANAMGALTTTKSGAIPSIPSLKEVEEYLGSV